MRGGERAHVHQLLETGSLYPVHDAEVAVEEYVERRQFDVQGGDRRLHRIELLLRKPVPFDHDGAQPVRVHRAGGETRRLQNTLSLLPLDGPIALEEPDRTPAADDLFE